MRKYFFVYTEIYFRIYENILPYTHFSRIVPLGYKSEGGVVKLTFDTAPFDLLLRKLRHRLLCVLLFLHIGEDILYVFIFLELVNELL